MKIAYIKNGDAAEQVKIITSDYDKKIINGTEAFIYDLLVHNRNETFLILSIAKKNKSYCYKNIKVRVFSERSKKRFSKLNRILANIKIFFYILKFKPNRIICGCIRGQLWISYLAACVLRIPIVHSRHNLIYEKNISVNEKINLIIEKKIISRLDGVVTHGPFLYQQIKQVGVKTGKVYEFDVEFTNTDNYQKNPEVAAKSLTKCKNRKYILYVGRIEKNKGVFDLLSAAINVLKKDQDIYVLYVGKGEAFEELKNKIIKMNMEKRIILLGMLDHQETLSIIKNAYCLICPTRSDFPEGRCMVAMEGNRFGVPIIAPNFGPFPYLIKHQMNGLLYEVDSVENLSRCLQRILYDEKLYKELKKGAIESGILLRKPIRTFNQAIDLSFS